LEQYALDRIPAEEELKDIEEHLLWCEHCLDYVEEFERFIAALKAGNRLGGFDVETMAEEFKTWRTRVNEK
jgi:hypothetical protein